MQIKNTFYYAGVRAVSLGLPFLFTPIFARLLGPEQYGLQTLFVTLSILLGLIVGLASNGVASRFYIDKNDHNYGLRLTTTFFIVTIWAVVCGCLLKIFSNFVQDWTGLSEQWIFIALIAAYFQAPTTILAAIFRMESRPFGFGAVTLFNQILFVSISLILVVGRGWGWQGLAIGYTSGMVISGLACFFILNKNFLRMEKITPAEIGVILKYGGPLTIHAVAAFLILSIDRFLLARMASIHDTGLYSLATQMALLMSFAGQSVNLALTPDFWSKLKEGTPRAAAQLVKLIYQWALLFILLYVVIFLLRGFILQLLGGDQFKSALTYVPWLLAAQLFNCLYLLVSNYLFYLKATHVIALNTSLCFVINLCVSYFLITRYGTWGAARGTCLAQFLLFIFTVLWATKKFKINWFRFRDNEGG